ncbi:hypothetical protein GCM10027189_25030 [Rufibacter soli]
MTSYLGLKKIFSSLFKTNPKSKSISAKSILTEVEIRDDIEILLHLAISVILEEEEDEST